LGNKRQQTRRSGIVRTVRWKLSVPLDFHLFSFIVYLPKRAEASTTPKKGCAQTQRSASAAREHPCTADI
jgi:hypothetical protein